VDTPASVDTASSDTAMTFSSIRWKSSLGEEARLQMTVGVVDQRFTGNVRVV
jgi:hypothetical protein